MPHTRKKRHTVFSFHYIQVYYKLLPVLKFKNFNIIYPTNPFFFFAFPKAYIKKKKKKIPGAKSVGGRGTGLQQSGHRLPPRVSACVSAFSVLGDLGPEMFAAYSALL